MERGIMLEGTLYHPIEYFKSVKWKYSRIGEIGGVVIRSIEPGIEEVIDLGRCHHPKEHVLSAVDIWAKGHGYVHEIPMYVQQHNPDVPWVVTHQEGIAFQVEFMCYGRTRKAQISIPGADGKLSEELVRTAIVNEIQGALRKHKYIGMSGVFKEAKKDGDGK